MHPLDDPRAKIRRAYKHLDEFETERQKWLVSNPYAVFSYPNADRTEWKFAVHRFDEEVKPESDIFGLIIGDYVHNLRSALDQLVWKLVTVANKITPERDADVSFPIVTSHPTKFWSRPMIVRAELTFEQALFIEGFQPYRSLGAAKRNALAELNTLWNTDKHQLVTAVRATLHKNGPVFALNPDAGAIVKERFDSEVALEGDVEVAWVTIAPVGPDPQVDVQYLPVDVAFGESGRLVQDLPNLRLIVEEIVENCARFFDEPT